MYLLSLKGRPALPKTRGTRCGIRNRKLRGSPRISACGVMSPRFKVVITDQVFPSIDTEARLLAGIGASIEVADGTPEGVGRLAGDADALLNTYLPITEDLLAQLSSCKIIARYGIGVDNVDLAAAARRGLVVTNVPDYSVEEVAVHALGLLLSLVRRLPEASALVARGGWGLDGLRPIRRLSTQRVGLVGFGRIARQLAGYVSALGAEVVVHDPFIQPGPGIPALVTLDELLTGCDAVSLHAPLTARTRNLIGAAELAAMKPDAVLVNTARGGLVDIDALIEALRAGRIRAAALDVLDREPPAGRLPVDLPNLLVTPHMAYYSEESIAESQRKAATQIIKVLTGGQPDYPVRP
jgi:D-3-phosphoglycerate dehydrogenase / 2-oxoglutarate reductase